MIFKVQNRDLGGASPQWILAGETNAIGRTLYGGGKWMRNYRVLREMSLMVCEEEAYKRFFMVDKQGLLFDDMMI